MLSLVHTQHMQVIVLSVMHTDDDEPPVLLGFFTEDSFLIENVGVPKATAALMAKAGVDECVECGIEGMMLFEDETHWATPHTDSVRWLGPVIVLVNRQTTSNGDMSAMALQKAGANVVGFEGSSGSVSLSDGNLLLPGVQINYTQGQSWDKEYQVQLEAGANGQGGVLPDTPIPRTTANLHAWNRWMVRSATDGALEPDAEDVELLFAKDLLRGLRRESFGQLWSVPDK